MRGTFPVLLVNMQQFAGIVSHMPLFGKKRREQRQKALHWLERLTQIKLGLIGPH